MNDGNRKYNRHTRNCKKPRTCDFLGQLAKDSGQLGVEPHAVGAGRQLVAQLALAAQGRGDTQARNAENVQQWADHLQAVGAQLVTQLALPAQERGHTQAHHACFASESGGLMSCKAVGAGRQRVAQLALSIHHKDLGVRSHNLN